MVDSGEWHELGGIRWRSTRHSPACVLGSEVCAPTVVCSRRCAGGNPGIGKAIALGLADDERGSREYNLALSARQAEAVKRALELLGADGGKIKTVSFGSAKPVALGKDGESYSQNRRADIVN